MSINNIIYFPETKDSAIKNAHELLSHDSATEALKVFQELANNGENESYMYLGAIYEFGGNGLNVDYDKARHYYEISIETVGAVESYYGLARLYYFGKGVPIDYERALSFYQKVYAEYYDCFSPYMIGKMYLYGLGVNKDLEVAESYLRESVNRGHILGLSLLSIVEKQKRNSLMSILYKIKAGYKTYKLAGKSPNDIRIREQ